MEEESKRTVLVCRGVGSQGDLPGQEKEGDSAIVTREQTIEQAKQSARVSKFYRFVIKNNEGEPVETVPADRLLTK